MSSLTQVIDERITPLPPTLLPGAECKLPVESARKRSKVNDRVAKRVGGESGRRRVSGLDATVVEMLRNYQPSSSERRPFWCRICRYQGGDEADLVRHRASESHRRAIRVERRLSFCSKCRKQFTSPSQLKEHLKGKAHLGN